MQVTILNTLIFSLMLTSSLLGSIDSSKLGDYKVIMTFTGDFEVSPNNIYKKPFPLQTNVEFQVRPIFSQNNLKRIYPIFGFSRSRWQHYATGNLFMSNSILTGVGFSQELKLESISLSKVFVFIEPVFEKRFTIVKDYNYEMRKDFNFIYLNLVISKLFKLKHTEIGPYLALQIKGQSFEQLKNWTPSYFENKIGLIIKI